MIRLRRQAPVLLHRLARCFTSANADASTRRSRVDLRKLLVANRGEIACRVLTSARWAFLPLGGLYGLPSQHAGATAHAC